jgi:hypothetical protein
MSAPFAILSFANVMVGVYEGFEHLERGDSLKVASKKAIRSSKKRWAKLTGEEKKKKVRAIPVGPETEVLVEDEDEEHER